VDFENKEKEGIFMGSIVIKINPGKLVNPDAGIRYLIPDKIKDLTSGKITDDGYAYLEDEVSSMAIYLRSNDPEEDVKAVCEILRNNVFEGNQIYDVSEIFVSNMTADELDERDYDLSAYKQYK